MGGAGQQCERLTVWETNCVVAVQIKKLRDGSVGTLEGKTHNKLYFARADCLYPMSCMLLPDFFCKFFKYRVGGFLPLVDPGNGLSE